MLSAGQRDSRVRFERRLEVNPDAPADYGNVESSWAPITTVWAGFLPARGQERQAADAQTSTLTGTITVLRSATTDAVEADCRAVFVAGPYRGSIANIRTVEPTGDNREIRFTAEIGAPT